jgi:hypothetical protein
MLDEHRRKLEGATLHAIRELIGASDADVDRPIQLTNVHNDISAQLIWTLTNHATEATRTFVELASTGRMLVAMPLLRIALEAAATCRWLHLDATGAGDVYAEALRQHRASTNAAVARGDPAPHRILEDDAEWAKLLDPLHTTAGRQLSERFALIPNGDVMYAEYRRASSLSHAGLALANEYLDEVSVTADNPAGIAFSPVNVLDGSGRWALSALSTLIYAYSTVNEIDVERRLEAALDRASMRAMILTAEWVNVDGPNAQPESRAMPFPRLSEASTVKELTKSGA